MAVISDFSLFKKNDNSVYFLQLVINFTIFAIGAPGISLRFSLSLSEKPKEVNE